jgi:hypothetical protein
MNNTPNWFNESNYADFLTESSFLLELNVPYQKQKFENRKKIAQFDRETAIRRGRLKSELTRDLYRAKAKGVQESVFAKKIQQIHDEFIKNLLNEAESKRTPIKAEKSRMRPQLDPKDKDRNRKREERRQKSQSGLNNIIIVKNNKLNRIEIITKEDYNEEAHTLLKGKIKKQDKGDVNKRDLKYYSGLENFMNTKTSIRLLGGRVEKEKPKKDQKKSNETKQKETPAPEQTPPPRPRVPQDGKEITDPTSSYPDWDHTNDQFIGSVPDALNSLSGGKPSKEYEELMAYSRTLGDSMQRFVKEIFAAFPAAAEMKFTPSKPVVNTGKGWKGMGVKQAASNATLIGKGKGQQVGVVLKIGEQLRPVLKGEAGLIFNTILQLTDPQEIYKTFGLFVKDFIEDLKRLYSSREIFTGVQNNFDGTSQLIKDREEKEKIQNSQKSLLNKAGNLIESYLNENHDLKGAFLLEALSGNIKFEGKEGSAQMLFAAKKDGSETRAIPLDQNFAETLAKSKDTDLSLKFQQTPNTSNGFLQNLFAKLSATGNTNLAITSELEYIKDQLSNPLMFLQMMELQITDAVFINPVIFSDYYIGDTDISNIVIFNKGSSSEQEIQIPVHPNYNPQGDVENTLEKGTDALLEEYALINDYFTNKVKNNTLTANEALLGLQEYFALEERDYRAEYDNYHSKPEQRANRSKRVLARRKMEEKGEVSKGDGNDVHHEDGNPQNNGDSNLKVLPKSKNRSMNEDHGAGFEGTQKLVRNLLKATPFSNAPYIGNTSVPYSEIKQLKKKKK